MKCYHCGYENELDFGYCPSCGRPSMPCVSENPAAATLLAALKDNLFLIICILMTAACGLSIVAENMPLLNILITIFLWLTYAQAKKGVAEAKHLRQISGTVFAQYIITYVLAGLLVFMGVICGVAFGILAATPEFAEELLLAFGELEQEFAQFGEFGTFDIFGEYGSFVGTFASVIGIVIFAIFTFVGIVTAVINAFSMRYLHKLAQSAYQSIEKGRLELKHVGAARGWLIVFAVCTGLSALGSLSEYMPMLALSEGCLCAVDILCVVLINKYLKPVQ